MATDNKTLGKFILDGIPPAPRGVPQVEVVFDIDANGILQVRAKDKATGKEQSIRIEASSGLSKDEIERMKREAEMNADADKKKRELIEARNIADTLIYTSEKMLKEADEKKIEIVAADRQLVLDKIQALKSVKDTENLEEIKATGDALSEAAQKVGAAMYQHEQKAGAAGAQPGATNEPKKDEGPIEGEVVNDKN